jgi:tetratricopeptide (TPR) repeat protein
MDRADNKRRAIFTCLLLSMVTIAALWPITRCGFINYDDEDYVTENPQVSAGLTARGVAWAFGTGWAANWHPLTWVSHMLDAQFYGLSPAGHHLTSLGLHVVNTMLVYLVLNSLTAAHWRSAIVAGLFGLHPLHVQSVAWIAERKDVLSGVFFLLTVWAYVKYVSGATCQVSGVAQVSGVECRGKERKTSEPLSRITNHAPRFYLLSLLLFALGLMSKPMLVTLPFVLLLLDYWPLGRVTGDEWRVSRANAVGNAPRSTLHAPPCSPPTLRLCLLDKIPFFILSAASCVTTFLVQQHSGAVASVRVFSFADRLGNAVVSYARYLGKTFWPDQLAVFYPHPNAWGFWQIAGAAALVVLVSGLAVFLARRFGFLFTGWFWFVGMLVPVIGLVQVGEQAMADRYTYLPLIGLFVAATWGIAELAARAQVPRTILTPIAVMLLGACVIAANFQTRYWQNSKTLFAHGLEVTPNNAVAHFGLAKALCEEGRREAASEELRQALALEPGFAKARGQLAYVLCARQQFEEGIKQYTEALANAPDLVEALNNLAWIYATHPDPKFRNGAQAVRLAERACQVTHYQKTLFMGTLAAAYAEAGRFDEAVAMAGKARDHALSWKETLLAEKNEQLLQLYRSGKPYREPVTVSNKD